MLANYLRIALRNIIRNKLYSLISILGLALGIGSLFLILLFIRHETNYDNFHTNLDRIYRVVVETNFSGQINLSPRSYAPLGPALNDDYPQIASVLRLRRMNCILMNQNIQFEEQHLYYADSSFFKVFSYSLTSGNPITALNEPYTMVITEQMARKYFGDEDPLNKTIRCNNAYDLRITGVMSNPPKNSHLHFNGLISFQTAVSLGVNRNFGHAGYFTYLLMEANTSVEEIEKDSPDFIARHFGEQYRENFKLHLQSLNRIHLHSFNDYGFYSDGNSDDLFNLLLIGILIIVVASINYSNLAIAVSTRRAREVAIRRTLGAFRKQLAIQFLGESLTLAFLAMFIPLILTGPLLPFISDLVNRELVIGSQDFVPLAIIILSLSIGIGFISGMYPAYVFARIPVVSTLKGTYRTNPGKSITRKLLIVFQFSISIVLIVGTIVIYNQISLMKDGDLGFDGDNVIVIPFGNSPLSSNWEVFGNEIQKFPSVLEYSASLSYPGSWLTADPFVPEGRDQSDHSVVNVFRIDHNFLNTYGITIVQGRGFSQDLQSDGETGVIINESAVRAFGWESPIGKTIEWTARGSHTYKVIGIVKDFHYQSLREHIEPVLLQLIPEYAYISVKMGDGITPTTLDRIEEVWHKFAPDIPFEYFYVNDRFANQYREEERKLSIIGTLSFLAVFIACLGVFGLTSYEMVTRTKEIGIRKVLGASTAEIFFMLSIDMCKPILIAIIIGCPIAYHIMNRWLESYAYRIDMHWIVFSLVGVFILILAMVTISYQSIKAALTKPASSLRSH